MIANLTAKAKLTKQGYIINKSDLTPEQIENLENELTIEPEVDQRYKKIADDGNSTFNIYLETVTGDKFVLPRYYGIEKFGEPKSENVKFNLNDIDRANIKFNGQLRDYQKEVMDTILKEYCTNLSDPKNSLKQYGGSIISIPPGKGKTVLAINLATQLGLRALVIVNKTFLLNQWKERINQYTDASVGIIRQDKIDISNKQFVVAMLHSVSMKDYDRELFQAFPLVIYDECHHLGAKVFSKSLIKVQAPYYLGLSATPERKDHMDKVFKYFLGDIKYRGKFEPNNQVKVRLYSYQIKHTLFKSKFNPRMKQFMAPTMITNVCKIDERNNFIIKIIKDILQAEPNRKILVLSGRVNASKTDKGVNHLEELSNKLSADDNHAENWGYYVGGMKRINLDISSEKQIILGTYDMAQEGLDISDLDTLILASPLKGDITQTCGRILRGGATYAPLIVDIIDQIKPFSEQGRSRYGYYKTNKYSCEFYNVDNGYNIKQDGIVKLDDAFLTPTQKYSKKEEIDEDPFDDAN
jgi:superfamily II DNA or RNA helicase